MARDVTTTCGFCGVGCALRVHVRDGAVAAVTPADGPVNRGHACVKGRFAHAFARSGERITEPLLRHRGRGSPLEDVDRADCVLLAGANPTEAHPVVGARIKQRVLQGARLIVVDPRRTESAALADVHLRNRPGTNVAVFNALARLLIEHGHLDEEFLAARTTGLDALRALPAEQDPQEMARIAAVPLPDLEAAADLYGRAERPVIVYGLGVTEHLHGTDGVRTLANLALLKGAVGTPGCCGVLPLRGQNNVQGASDPDTAHVTAALRACELVVVHDLFPSATTEHADVVFPAASFLEKDGTFVNFDRRVQRVRPATDPPGEARPDFEILHRVSRAMGEPLGCASPAEALAECARLTPLFGGVSHERLDREGPLHWPCRDARDPGRAVLYLDRFATPDGRAALAARPYLPPGEQPDARFPYLLVTGRRLVHYNTGSMTRRTPNAALLPARITDEVGPGELFTAFHFPDAPANRLTSAHTDTATGCPEHKVTAVAVRPYRTASETAAGTRSG